MSISILAFIPDFERRYFETAVSRLAKYLLFVTIDRTILEEVNRDWNGYFPIELSVPPQNPFGSVVRSKVQTGFEFAVARSTRPKSIKLSAISTESPNNSIEIQKQTAWIEEKLATLPDAVELELSLTSPCYSVGFAFAAALVAESDGLLFDLEEEAFITYSEDLVYEILKSDMCEELRDAPYN